MRLALISDIHGNHVALEAVLTAISAQDVSHIICLGDVASTGPQPCEVIVQVMNASGMPHAAWWASHWREG